MSIFSKFESKISILIMSLKKVICSIFYVYFFDLLPIPTLIVRVIKSNTMHDVQELNPRLLSCSAKAILASFASSTVSIHSSTIY